MTLDLLSVRVHQTLGDVWYAGNCADSPTIAAHQRLPR